MTGRQAIKLLNAIWEGIQDWKTDEDYMEAIDFAIEAIRSQDKSKVSI